MLDRYSRDVVRRLWSDAHRYDIWLEIELAACRAMESRGRVPAGTTDAVTARASGRLDAPRILAIEATPRHDVIAFLTHVEEVAGEAARWLHYGMTSSDVLDAALAIQLRDAGHVILEGLDALRAALRRRAEEHRGTPVIGRSHGIHAEPTSLGLVFASFHAETGRARHRLVAAIDAISVGKIAGAVGTYGNGDPAVEAEALAAVGLRPETVATQVVARDRHAEYFGALALVGAAIERIALTIRHWQRTEVGEAEEAFGQGQKGSSAMPHKKNPILSENLCGLSRMLRSYAQAALEDVALWHERDISHSSVERMIGPDATTLCDFMLARATGLVDGLVVHPERCRENLERTRGLVFSEGVMLRLVETGLPRQRAYELVQKSALRAHAGEGTLRALLAEDPEVTARLDAHALDEVFDLQHHLRHTEVILERCFAKDAR